MEYTHSVTLSDSLRIYKVRFAVTLLLLGCLYYPVVPSMVMQWYDDPNYSHGFLVPLIAGYFLYQRLGDLNKMTVRPESKGLFIILSGLFMLIVGYAGTEFFTMRASMVVILTGMVLYFFGKDILKAAALPLGYLFFMVPLPYIVYDAFAFPLKLFVAKYSVIFLKMLGIVVWREGNIIMFPNSVFEVADACSGIRSLMSLIALSAALAYFFHDTLPRRLAVVLSAIPIALFANWTRVVVTGILAQYRGARAAEGFFHDFAGVAVFGIATAMLIAVGLPVGRR